MGAWKGKNRIRQGPPALAGSRSSWIQNDRSSGGGGDSPAQPLFPALPLGQNLPGHPAAGRRSPGLQGQVGVAPAQLCPTSLPRRLAWRPGTTPAPHGVRGGPERGSGPHAAVPWLVGAGGGQHSWGAPSRSGHLIRGAGGKSCAPVWRPRGDDSFWRWGGHRAAAALFVHIPFPLPMFLVPDCVIRCPGVSPILFR